MFCKTGCRRELGWAINSAMFGAVPHLGEGIRQAKPTAIQSDNDKSYRAEGSAILSHEASIWYSASPVHCFERSRPEDCMDLSAWLGNRKVAANLLEVVR